MEDRGLTCRREKVGDEVVTIVGTRTESTASAAASGPSVGADVAPEVAMTFSEPDPSPVDLLDITSGFTESSLLMLAVESGILDLCGDFLSPEVLARGTGLEARRLEPILLGLASLGVLVRRDGCYRTAQGLREHLSGPPGGQFRSQILAMKRRWGVWSRLEEYLEEEEPRSPVGSPIELGSEKDGHALDPFESLDRYLLARLRGQNLKPSPSIPAAAAKRREALQSKGKRNRQAPA